MANNDDPLEIRALSTLLRETLQRADRQYAFLLNPGDPGMVETLKSLSAETASKSLGQGRKPIVSHANHVLYGIELANRALGGEQGVYELADWSVAWKLETVSDDQWHDLVDRLEQQSKLLIEQISEPREWNEITLTGSFSIAAHTAYHLGAIRQMLLDIRR
jgi:hypothetical protein